MNCRRIQSLIPLYVEGDLKAEKVRQVRSHLEECSECACVSSEYRDSQQWLKSYTPPDFESDFFDVLRGGVLREIEARETEASRPRQSGFYPFGLRFAFNSTSLALASLIVFAAFVGLALYAYPSMRNDEVPPYLRGDAGATQVPGLDDRAPSEVDWRLPGPKPRPPRPAPKPERARDLRQARESRTTLATLVKGASAEPSSPVAVGDEPLKKVFRIELQTGDPNIRIIWFAPSEPNAEDSKLIISAETE